MATEPPKESLVQRYKVVWRLLLISNLALGAYLFARARKKDTVTEHGKAADKVPPVLPTASPTTTIPEEPVISSPIVEPVKIRDPIPDDQQRELFKWILEEKRKVKPMDPEEKKRIDEEKAILKEFIRSKSIPSL
ncbi:hypothetical protein RJ640_021608 [Escallonia rubra]|uniref:Uncharacterized protein n=1 Tax=Escallonia rubra TaxID=112253 RepID=A0AA88UJP2_9ASTE|nr:hypothetical protein RJ640_021608 [Escallonia rubra]